MGDLTNTTRDPELARRLQMALDGLKFGESGSDYYSRRKGEIETGLDSMLPDADSADYRMKQNEVGGEFSRDQLRSVDIANLRRFLKMKEDDDAEKRAQMAIVPNINANADIEKQRIANEGGMAQQEAQNRGALAVEQERQRGATSAAQSRLDALNQMLSAGQRPSRISMSNSGISASLPERGTSRIPATTMNRIATLRAEVEKSRPSSFMAMFGKNNKAQQDALDQAITAAFVESGAPAEIQGLARTVAQKFPNGSVDDALGQLGEDSLTPEEYQQLNDLVSIIRGR